MLYNFKDKYLSVKDGLLKAAELSSGNDKFPGLRFSDNFVLVHNIRKYKRLILCTLSTEHSEMGFTQFGHTKCDHPTCFILSGDPLEYERQITFDVEGEGIHHLIPKGLVIAAIENFDVKD